MDDTSDFDVDDSDTSDDTSYSESSSDSGSESSNSYYDDCPDDVSTFSSGDADDNDSDSGSSEGSSGDDESGSDQGDDTVTATTAATPTESTTGATNGETGGTTGTAGPVTEPAAATQDPAPDVPCPPAFPLSGVTGPDATAPTTAPTTVEPAAADAGTPAVTGTPITEQLAGYPTPMAVDPAGAGNTHVSVQPGTIEPPTTTETLGGYIPTQQPQTFQGVPQGILTPAEEQTFVQNGWTPATVPDGHGGQVQMLQPTNVDAATFAGQLQFLNGRVTELLQQQGALPAPARTVAEGLPPGTVPAGTVTHTSINYVPQQVGTQGPVNYGPPTSQTQGAFLTAFQTAIRDNMATFPTIQGPMGPNVIYGPRP